METINSDKIVLLGQTYPIQWRRKWQPTPVFLPGRYHGQKSLMGYSPWGAKSQTWQQKNNHHPIQLFQHYLCQGNHLETNRGPKHSTEIIKAKRSRNIHSKHIQSRRNWSHYCDWFSLITFDFFPRTHSLIFGKKWKHSWLADLHHEDAGSVQSEKFKQCY